MDVHLLIQLPLLSEAISSRYAVTNYNGYNVSCNGSNDLNVNILWSGGTPPYQNWFNGTFTNDSVQNNLSSGTYIDSLNRRQWMYILEYNNNHRT